MLKPIYDLFSSLSEPNRFILSLSILIAVACVLLVALVEGVDISWIINRLTK